MHLPRPIFAPHPGRFGRRPVRVVGSAAAEASSLRADVKLFASTFAAGFLFVSILIG